MAVKKSISWVEKLRRELPQGTLKDDAETLILHSKDAWLASHLPEAVVFPKSVKIISQILRFANRYRIPVTVRGAGRGYVGGCVPSRGGIVLSLVRMNRIKEIHVEDGVAVVQPGVITERLQFEVKKRGLFYPPDPASLKECFIGGNIATNAGGPRCLKYGVTRHYVLGLEVVLADGSVARVGGRTLKNKTGFDLVGLFVGSEGLLGIVTEATLRLIPHPKARAVVSAGFTNVQQAASVVQQILQSGLLPAAIEIADRFTLEAARKYSGRAIIPKGKAHLLVEVDGSLSSITSEIQSIVRLFRVKEAVSIQTAKTETGCEELWKLRRSFSSSLRASGLDKLNEDITVPRSRLVDLFVFAEKLQCKYQIPVACFGHAGDGNIHVNLMVDLKQKKMRKEFNRALDEMFCKVLEWDGAITGEHGIGLAKKRWWSCAVSKEVRQLHSQIKSALDPLCLLNPGKFV